MKTLKKEDGFTFIEIVGVLVIISVIAAVAINKFVDFQGRARGKVIRNVVSELRTRVNSHFCDDLLNGVAANAITYPADRVDIYLGKDFLVENWDDSDPDFIKFDITYYPYLNDKTKHTVKKVGLTVPKPQFV